ncbi:MAG: hypothetical protein JWM80_1215 [Cyanobacteria bacterium RYN_339]|nr:hypothetical protein [Cyanobacteria bacterium RYN_339]
MPITFEYAREGAVTCTNVHGLTFYLQGQPVQLAATFLTDSSLTSTSQVHNRVSAGAGR